MNQQIEQLLMEFFPLASKNSSFLASDHMKKLVKRFDDLSVFPLDVTQFNQLLHLNHEAGVSPDCFRFYFLEHPANTPYDFSRYLNAFDHSGLKGIQSVAQFALGLRRFFMDSLLFFGDIRRAYKTLRNLSHDQLVAFYESKRFRTDSMQFRGPVLPFHNIPIEDRYLISETAYTGLTLDDKHADGLSSAERMLLQEFRDKGGTAQLIRDLVSDESNLAKLDPQGQYMLKFVTTDIHDKTMLSEEQIRSELAIVRERFEHARVAALMNSDLYLSIVNELDVYVATSMRDKPDFLQMARDCETIFRSGESKGLRLRYFDPTMSAAQNHEDKGLIECLMVKCAKALVYIAGEKDSFGKDAEVAMAMSLGKPTIILCPDSDKGTQRMNFFRDVHPLSRLINFQTGVVSGAIVTKNVALVATLLHRIFTNSMQYEMAYDQFGYFRLREVLTGSVVRLQTSSAILRESFWNYYGQFSDR